MNRSGKHTVTGLQQNYYLGSYLASKQGLPVATQPDFGPVSGFGPISFTRSLSSAEYETLEVRLRAQLSNISTADLELILASYLYGCVYN